jgi:hypothetical protein
MWTAADLVAAVKLRAMLPTSSSAPGTADSDVLAHANDELQSRLVPLLMSVNEEFFTFTTDVALVSGQAVYRVPDRAAAAKLRELNLVSGNVLLNLPRIEPEQLTRFLAGGAVGVPAAFVMEAGGVRLVPTPSASSMTLRMRFFFRPGELTATTSNYATITTATPTSSTEVTLTLGTGLVPSASTSYLYDLISGRPPFEYLAMDGTCESALTPYDMRFSAGYSGLQSATSAIGWTGADYLAVRGLSPVPQLPSEVHPLLVQRTLCRVLQQLGRYETLDRAEREADRLEKVALSLLSPRVDGAPRKMRGVLQSSRRWLGF